MSELGDTRSRINSACAQLVEQGRPVTRAALAQLAGCTVRTVSNHKDLWKHFAPNEPEKQSLSLCATEVVLLSQRLDHLSKVLETAKCLDDLKSYEAALRWFLLVISDERRDDCEHLRDRVKNLLFEFEKKTRQLAGLP